MKIIQYMNRRVPIYMDCIKRGIIDRLPLGVDYTLLQMDPYNCACRNNDPRSPSEELRLRLAIDNPDMVWLDTDVAIRSWPAFEQKGKPYLIQSDHILEEGAVEEYIFYVNGCTGFFQELLDDYLRDPTKTDNFWLAEAVLKRKNEVYIIPKSNFVHCRFSVLKTIPSYWEEIPGDGYTIKKINDEPSLILHFK